MNPDIFINSPAGAALKVGRSAKAYYAFVPNSLPPEIKLDRDLWLICSDADRALGELAGQGRKLPNPHLLIKPFIRREAALSSRIEGTKSNVKDLYAFEAKQLTFGSGKIPTSELDVREVMNYVVAMEYGLERLNSLPVSLRYFRELHQRLMQGVRGKDQNPGEFRRAQNFVRGTTEYNAEFVFPPVPEMKLALNDLEKYIQEGNGHPPLVRLAILHYQFETIHPFLDGNGRIGRLLTSLLLVHWNLLPLPLLYLSAFFERHKQQYNDLLFKISERGNWSDWVKFFLEGVKDQAQDAINRAKRLEDLQTNWRELLTKDGASSRLLHLMESLFESPYIPIPKAQKILGVTYRSAKNNVEKLVKAGILQQADESTYAKVFIAGQIFKIIDEDY